MSLKTLVSDLQKIDPPDAFETGNVTQKNKLNQLIKVAEDILAAANREAADEAGGGDAIEIYCVFNGGLTLVRFTGATVLS